MEQTGRPDDLVEGQLLRARRVPPRQSAALREQFPDAKVVVHPESLREVRDLADAVCSTEKMITYCQTDPAKQFMIVTESGIIHRMQKECPGKEFLCAPDIRRDAAADGQLPLQRVQIHEDEHAGKSARLHEAPRPADRTAGRHLETRPAAYRADAGDFGEAVAQASCLRVPAASLPPVSMTATCPIRSARLLSTSTPAPS